MAEPREVLKRIEAVLTELQQTAWQQRAALVALRIGVVEAVTAQQHYLLQQLQQCHKELDSAMESIAVDCELRQWWERLKLQAAEVRRLLQLNRFLAQRAQHHTAALLEIVLPEGHLYSQQA